MPKEKVCQKCSQPFWSTNGKRYCEDCRYVGCAWCGKRKLIAHPKQNEGRFCCRLCKTAWRAAHSEEIFWNYVDTSGECWEFRGGRHSCGYGVFNVGYGKDVYAHRYSWQLANGSIMDNMSILHHCDNPPCVRPEHLYAGTVSDNTQDMLARKRTPRMRVPYEVVCEVRERYGQGNVTQQALADEYGVSESWVGHVVNNEIRQKH